MRRPGAPGITQYADGEVIASQIIEQGAFTIGAIAHPIAVGAAQHQTGIGKHPRSVGRVLASMVFG